MTTLTTQVLRSPKTGDLATGLIRIRSPYDQAVVDGTTLVKRKSVDLPLVNGQLSVTVTPGDYEVSIKVVGATRPNDPLWLPITVPASGTVDLFTLVSAFTQWTPPVVSAAQTAATQAASSAADALASKNAAALSAQRLDAVVAGAPTALDTLDELAAALGDDANFAATVTTALNARPTKAAADAAYAAKAAPLLRSLASHASRPITPYAGALPDVPKTIPGSNPTFTAAGYQLFSDANPKFRIEDAVLTDTGSGTGKNVITGGQDENSYTIATDARVTGSSEYLAIVAFVGSSEGDFNPSLNDQPLTQVCPKWGEAAGMITFQLPLPAGFSRIRIPMGMAQFSNIQWSSGVVLAKPPRRRQAAWLGDSYGAGINLGGTEGYTNAGSVPNRWAQLTGDAVWNLSQGGTGAVYGTGGPNNRSPYGSTSRRAALAALPADLAYLVVQASVNDGLALNAGTTTQPAIQDAYAALFAQIATDRPGLPVIVLGVEANTQENGKQDQVNTAAKSAALAAPNVVTYIDQRAAGWVTGTGKVSAPVGDGNRDLVIGTDNIHPSRDYGNEFVARSALRALGA